MKNYRKEIAVGGALIVLLITLMNPGDILMPSMTQMVIITATTVAFAVFAILLWRERGGDERDQLHRFVADRIAFQVGGAAMMAAIIAQGLTDMVDPWLPFVLGAMVLGKIVGLIYSKNKY